jgi:uncharacterized protein
VKKNRVQRVQDAIHGLMEFRGLETVVIEMLRTPELQRLRRIRQMGLAHLVFPGAEHSRLAHSLGASHLSIRFAKQIGEESSGVLSNFLRLDVESIRDFALAALCHDIGHGPLSHAWEREVIGGDQYDSTGWSAALGVPLQEGSPVPKWHELVGQGLLMWPDGELHLLLEQHASGFSERIMGLLRGRYYLPYLPALLSGDIDVDRSDFLLRDSHNCGVRYGEYDINWLISTCTIGFDSREKAVVGFDRHKAPRIVEQFLIARAAMYEAIYFHKTVRSVEGMVGMLLRRLRQLEPDQLQILLEDGRVFAPFVASLSGTPLPQSELIKLDDFLLWNFIDHVSRQDENFDVTATDLANRIIRRDLFKLVPIDGPRIHELMLEEDGHERLRDAASSSCPGEAEFYVLIDQAKYKYFQGERESSGRLIDPNTKRSERFEHCHEFSHLPKDEQLDVRLFTIREAVGTVEAVFQ